jgi:hypothetical protein
MCAARQCLWHVLATAGTILRRIFGADFHNGLGGSLSLVLQNQKELSPGGIRNHTGKVVVLEHPTNVEVFNINRIETTNEGIGRLMVEVQPCSRYAKMAFASRTFAFSRRLLCLPVSLPHLSRRLRRSRRFCALRTLACAFSK